MAASATPSRSWRFDNFATFCKGMDPTPIRDVTLVGLNVPCRIGEATCMPGDVVLGTMTGILFIPPHLAEAVVEHSERTHMREMFQPPAPARGHLQLEPDGHQVDGRDRGRL